MPTHKPPAEPSRRVASRARGSNPDHEGDKRDQSRGHESPDGRRDPDSDCERVPDRNRCVRKIVETTWYFGDDDDCRPGRDGDGKDEGGGSPGQGRPTRPAGSSSGRVGQGGALTTGDINQGVKPGVWGGPRADLDLPYLFMRANPGDLGARPVVNAPFWESPDIFVLAGVDPALAPDIPPALGQVAQAGQPNTIYAHVWNFGNAAANEVFVEFYWVNPSLGIDASTVTLISQTVTALGAKGSGQSHAIVKCPDAWIPTFVNGGHECLLVRIWDNPSDLPGQPSFDASWNRHIAQRNIHVNAASAPSAGAMGAALQGPAIQSPILIKVGPLFGAPANVSVERVAPSAVPWLQLRTGKRGVFPVMAPPTGVPSLSPPTTAGAGFPSVGGATNQQVHGDDKHIAFTTTDDSPGPGEAHVYRVTASQTGTIFGGYTIVVLG